MIIRDISQFHENPRLVAWVQTPMGRLSIWIVAMILWLPTKLTFLLPLFLGLVMIWPERRWLIVWLTAPLVALKIFVGKDRDLLRDDALFASFLDLLPAVLVALAIVLLCVAAARNFERLPRFVRKHPVLTLHLLTWSVILLYWQVFSTGAEETVWATLVLGLLPYLVWRCCYIMLSGQRGSAKQSSFADHLFYALPVFGGTNVPYGKGYDYLRRCWAADPESLARSQLAGIKLIILFLLWDVTRQLIIAVANGDFRGYFRFANDYQIAETFNLGIPRLGDLVAISDTLASSLPNAWMSLFLELILATLSIAIAGHAIIGWLRLFGFNVFRNTYKPLLAESIVEFWNRFYYYFKELLVEFFFYPVYSRYFRSHQRLRIFAAVFAAACLGNIYYHVLRDFGGLYQMSLAEALESMGPRAFYTLLLALGIYFSMLAQTRKRGGAQDAVDHWWEPVNRVRRIAGVWLFFALINIWNVSSSGSDFGSRTAFFFSLFGMDIQF